MSEQENNHTGCKESDFWAVTSYFNPAGWRRRLINYKLFRRELTLPLLTVEFSPNGQFELSSNDADVLIQLDGGDVMWQKERLLNIGFASLPEHVHYVAWLDCDIIFERPDWWKDAARALSQTAVIQPFRRIIHVDKASSSHMIRERLADIADKDTAVEYSVAYLIQQNKPHSLGRHQVNTMGCIAAPGVAWAAHREILRESGLYDKAILGGGDRAALGGFLGAPNQFFDILPKKIHEAYRSSYLAWAEHMACLTERSTGFIDGTVYHLWHGSLLKRRYSERYDILAENEFDPENDIVASKSGPWQWRSNKPRLHAAVQNYFRQRLEDG